MGILRFGPFDLDSSSLELRRDGLRVALRPQPCALLVYLAERSGGFVSRAELHRHLWGDFTHVHFDQGLNSCVKQIRRALGDCRTTPVYIETLSRRGYRFVAAVEAIDADTTVAASTIEGSVITAIARTLARELASSDVARRLAGAPRAAGRFNT